MEKMMTKVPKLSNSNVQGQGHHRGGDDDALSHTNDNFNDCNDILSLIYMS